MVVFEYFGKQQGATPAAEVEFDGLEVALHESYSQFENLRGAIPDAMSSVYETVMLGNGSDEEKQAVIEGTLGDIWEKIKAFFRAIKNKVVAWFNAAKKWVSTFFGNNAKFVEKYKTEIETKDGSKFEYSGYYWKQDAFSKVPAEVDKAIDYAEGQLNNVTSGLRATMDAAVKKDLGKHINEEIDKNIIKDGSVEKFKKRITKAAHGGRDDRKAIKGFAATGKSEMVKVVLDSKEALTAFQETIDGISDAADKYEGEVDKLSEALNSEHEGNANIGSAVAKAREAAAGAKHALAYKTGFLELQKKLYTEMVSEYAGVLRAFVRYTPAKEDVQVQGKGEAVAESASLLDSFQF